MTLPVPPYSGPGLLGTLDIFLPFNQRNFVFTPPKTSPHAKAHKNSSFALTLCVRCTMSHMIHTPIASYTVVQHLGSGIIT